MSLRILRSRLSSVASSSSNRFLCTNAAPAAPLPSPPSATSPNRWSFLKYAVIAAFTGTTVFTGYASYAYTVDEIDEKTKSFRESVKYTPSEGATALDKFQGLLYSTAVTVPVKAVELYLDARRLIEEQVRSYTEPYTDKLLPDLLPQEQHVFTLVVDLNETLIHYIWTRETGWQTFKRPGVDAFLEHLAQFYEIVVYTDEQNMFVDPVIERLDPKHCIRYRLSRPATKYQDGKHYRDLSKLNRNPAKVLYLSGHAFESCLQPENCVPVKPWVQTDKDDTALVDFIPFLEFVARSSPADIRPVLQSYQGCDIPSEFIRRSKEHQKRAQGQKRFWRN
ncbi:mitochondrial import inner membrane translocase subunit TIM50 [Cicer arietinum]|uniref:Mitochondrial import inner membrane translocase subunit TIM50 n=1 Tax=Cicer arietinum TaxID=3827 RepID=A0A1S2XNM4_CICAR|nr:mitochondrial import inner membrane translocase subunit TIM50 [Cicer arietinum]